MRGKSKASQKNLEKNMGRLKNNTEMARENQKKSVESRKRRTALREIYTRDSLVAQMDEVNKSSAERKDDKTRLAALQAMAKLLGYDVVKTAQTDSEGNDITAPPVFNIVPVEVIHDKPDTHSEEDDVSLDGEQPL